VMCWGKGDVGQTGHANTANIGDDEVPSSAADVVVWCASDPECPGAYYCDELTGTCLPS
jgi:hypothetical protein